MGARPSTAAGPPATDAILRDYMANRLIRPAAHMVTVLWYRGAFSHMSVCCVAAPHTQALLGAAARLEHPFTQQYDVRWNPGARAAIVAEGGVETRAQHPSSVYWHIP